MRSKELLIGGEDEILFKGGIISQESIIEESFSGTKYKASRLNELKKNINSYFTDLGQGKIFEDDAGTAPLRVMMVMGRHHRRVIQNKNKILLSPRMRNQPEALKDQSPLRGGGGLYHNLIDSSEFIPDEYTSGFNSNRK
jgi:hypothetical protein